MENRIETLEKKYGFKNKPILAYAMHEKIYQKTVDRREYFRGYNIIHKIEHQEYYLQHKKEKIEYSKNYYRTHKDEINKRNKERRHKLRLENKLIKADIDAIQNLILIQGTINAKIEEVNQLYGELKRMNTYTLEELEFIKNHSSANRIDLGKAIEILKGLKFTNGKDAYSVYSPIEGSALNASERFNNWRNKKEDKIKIKGKIYEVISQQIMRENMKQNATPESEQTNSILATNRGRKTVVSESQSKAVLPHLGPMKPLNSLPTINGRVSLEAV